MIDSAVVSCPVSIAGQLFNLIFIAKSPISVKVHLIAPFCFILFFLLAAFDGRAQYAPENPQPAQFEFYLSGGGTATLRNNVGMAEIRELLPESDLLNRDYTGFNRFTDSYYSGSNISFGAAFNPFLKDDGSRKNIKFRAGFTRFGTESHGFGMMRTVRTPIDTLVSGTSDRTLQVDSVREQNFSAGVAATQYYLDLGVQFDSNWNSRWKGYVGANISIGILLDRQVRVSLTDWRYNDFDNERFDDDNYQTEEEFRTLSNAFGFMAGISAGIGWQVSEAHPFWSNVSLFGEWRPSMHLSRVPEFGTYVTPISFSHFGIRVRA